MFLLGAWAHWYSVFHGCSVNLASGEVTEEGALRGDKGAKIDTEVDQTGYLMRAVALARGEAYLLAGAFLCLGLSSISALILPSYQVLKAYHQLGLHYSFYLITLVTCLFTTHISSTMIGSFSILHGAPARVVKWT